MDKQSTPTAKPDNTTSPEINPETPTSPSTSPKNLSKPKFTIGVITTILVVTASIIIYKNYNLRVNHQQVLLPTHNIPGQRTL